MRPGFWSYFFGAIGLLAFAGTASLYVGATPFLPVWALVVLWAAWGAVLAFGIWLMRIAPGWALATPVLSVIVFAVLTGILEFIVVLTG